MGDLLNFEFYSTGNYKSQISSLSIDEVKPDFFVASNVKEDSFKE
jgi:hypothetical protein